MAFNISDLGSLTQLRDVSSGASGMQQILNRVGGTSLPTFGLDTLLNGPTPTSVGSGAVYNQQNTADKVQPTMTHIDKGAFRWVQQFVTPDMFATPESCLIGYTTPIKGSAQAGGDFKLLGFCETISINTGISVVTLKELRNERNIIIPVKSAPGSITLTRLLGNMPNFASTVNSGNKWSVGTQSTKMKKLFGLFIAFMTPSRKETITTLYAERCAIQSCSIAIQAGQFQMFENIQIIFDRIIDDNAVAPAQAPKPGVNSVLGTTIV